MSVYTQNHNIDGWPVCKDGEPMGRKDCLAELQKLEAQIAALKDENERLKVDAVNIRSQLSQVAKAMAWEPPYQASLVERAENLKESNDALKTRVAELESLVRDIRQHDIDETTKRILGGGRKFNYSLPLNIRERIAAALKERSHDNQ